MPAIELAISIRQPYVEQILLGVKPYEYRSTLTHIRGRVYLYAAMKRVDSAAEWRRARSEPGKLPTGVIVGSVVISGCEPRRGGGFRYRLEAPKRLRKYLTPRGASRRQSSSSRGCSIAVRLTFASKTSKIAISPFPASRAPYSASARILGAVPTRWEALPSTWCVRSAEGLLTGLGHYGVPLFISGLHSWIPRN